MDIIQASWRGSHKNEEAGRKETEIRKAGRGYTQISNRKSEESIVNAEGNKLLEFRGEMKKEK